MQPRPDSTYLPKHRGAGGKNFWSAMRWPTFVLLNFLDHTPSALTVGQSSSWSLYLVRVCLSELTYCVWNFCSDFIDNTTAPGGYKQAPATLFINIECIWKEHNQYRKVTKTKLFVFVVLWSSNWIMLHSISGSGGKTSTPHTCVSMFYQYNTSC
jgi:hypothetical protein